MAMASIMVFSSCASQRGIELVGRYKHNTESAMAGHSPEGKQVDEVAFLSAKPDELLTTELPDAASVISAEKILTEISSGKGDLSAKELTKAERLFQRIETKLEKKSLGFEQSALSAIQSSPASDLDQGWLILFAILLPPLAVGLAEGIGTSFWISILLTLLFWIPGVIYALIIVI